MIETGYKLSSEEHGPNDLVSYARRAEEVGFTFAMISDHYHPWTDRQGHSPFVWSVIGGIAQVTRRLRIGTGWNSGIERGWKRIRWMFADQISAYPQYPRRQRSISAAHTTESGTGFTLRDASGTDGQRW